jgi:hypothetical protein
MSLTAKDTGSAISLEVRNRAELFIRKQIKIKLDPLSHIL